MPVPAPGRAGRRWPEGQDRAVPGDRVPPYDGVIVRGWPAPTVTSASATPATGTAATGTGPSSGVEDSGPSSGTGGGAQPLPTGHAPTRSYSVGTQTRRLARGDRLLPTSVWYPARRAGSGTPAVTGTFPLVLFSHGLNGLPANYAPLLRRWAASGFVVAAPAYPHTRHGASDPALSDVVAQPADVSAVITAVLEPGRLRARVDPRRIAAAGHSAGGITTVLLFGPDRDPRLVAGVVLAGTVVNVAPTFRGSRAWLLFVHGDADPLVPYTGGRLAYRADPWAKAFLTLPGQGHADPYLYPGTSAYDEVVATTRDFLRLALYGDRAAGRRMAADSRPAGRLESDLPG